MIDIFSRAKALKNKMVKANNERLNRLDIKREKELKVLRGQNLVSSKRATLKSKLDKERKKKFKSSVLGKGLAELKKHKKGKTASQRAEEYQNRKPSSWL